MVIKLVHSVVVIVLLVWAFAASPASADGPQQFTGPFSPEEALGTFRLPKGFRIELVAAEPDVVDPVAMSFDADGRLYVVEMRDYPMGSPAPPGRIRLLEDTDADGRMDRSTVFMDGLSFPVGVMAWQGGVLVSAAPEILFLKDTDGDGKSDHREVLYTGFAENNPQHRANGLCYGIDNWIYGASCRGEIRPGKSTDAEPWKSTGSDFRIRPGSAEFEFVSGHSQFAMALDDWNNRFINNNANHIRHPVIERHYLKRNSYLTVPRVLEDISDHGALAQVFPLSKIEARFNEFHHAGYTTTACGLVVCRGGTYPPEYYGNSFCCEPLHNLIHRDVLVTKGISFVARRAETEQDRDFLASTDNWFRPVNLLEGPDGALYVADFYRPVIEHPFGIPVEMQKGLDFRAGDDRGRIYRVVHEAAPPARQPSLSKASSAQLVAYLEDDNAWWRVTAQRLLVDRQDAAAIEPLEELARASQTAVGRLHALWALEGLGALKPEFVGAAMGDSAPEVREQALRLSESRLEEFPRLVPAVLARAEDGNARVRFQAAFTLGEAMHVEESRVAVLTALARLLINDARDPRFRTAVLSSVSEHEVDLLARLHADAREFLETPGEGAIPFVRELADTVANRKNVEEAARFLKLVAGDDREEPTRWQLAALSPLVSRLHAAAVPLQPVTEQANVSQTLARWSARMFAAAADTARTPTERVEAISLFALAPAEESAPRLRELLTPQEPHDVQRAAVRALSSLPGEQVSSALLENWPSYTGVVREAILTSLLARSNRTKLLLDAIVAGGIRANALGAARRDQLVRHPDPEIHERAKQLFEVGTPSERMEKIAAVTEQVLAMAGNVDSGREIFLKKCANCHNRRTSTEGILHLSPKTIDVGPGLGALRTRSKQEFLQNILEPNRSVDPRFVNYIVATTDGRVVNGMILSESPASLTLLNGKDVIVITRVEIEELKNTGLSLMPEGMETDLKPQELADLLDFLRN